MLSDPGCDSSIHTLLLPRKLFELVNSSSMVTLYFERWRRGSFKCLILNGKLSASSLDKIVQSKLMIHGIPDDRYVVVLWCCKISKLAKRMVLTTCENLRRVISAIDLLVGSSLSP